MPTPMSPLITAKRHVKQLPFYILIPLVIAATLLVLLLLLSNSGSVPSKRRWSTRSDKLTVEASRHRSVECGHPMHRELSELEEIAVETYRQQLEQRKVAIQRGVDAHHPDYHHSDLYPLLVPEIKCDGLVRLGDVYDGGKWICSPSCVPDGGIIYSLGLADKLSFDFALYNITRGTCQLRMVDKDEQNEETKHAIATMNNAKLLMATIGSKEKVDEEEENGPDNEQSSSIRRMKRKYTLAELMQYFGDERIEILKMDIEGDENPILNEVLEMKSPPCQLLFEMHWQHATDKAGILRRLAERGYYLFAIEANSFEVIVQEFSLIHEQCLSTYGVWVIYGRYLA